jgi:hypothetical protein
MGATFHVEAGPFRIDVQLDDAGIRMERVGLGPAQNKNIPWDKITGATLMRPSAEEAADDQNQERMAQFLGPEALQKYHEMKGKVGNIFVAYHDERNALREAEVPVLLTDAAYLQEFQTRLGARWLGETRDRQQVARRLDTNPGFFKTIFVLVALLGIVTVVGAVLLFGLAAPILNFMSIQKMMLDLQDGNYASFGSRLAVYVALFAIGLGLHWAFRSWLDSMKRTRRLRPPGPP